MWWYGHSEWFRDPGKGYIAPMSMDLQDLIADVEISIIDAVDRLSQAESIAGQQLAA